MGGWVGCLARIHSNCQGLQSEDPWPICDSCWPCTDNANRERIKAKYNDIFENYKFCKGRGCWEVLTYRMEGKKDTESLVRFKIGLCQQNIDFGSCEEIHDFEKEEEVSTKRRRSRSRSSARKAEPLRKHGALFSHLRNIRHTLHALWDQVDDLKADLEAMEAAERSVAGSSSTECRAIGAAR